MSLNYLITVNWLMFSSFAIAALVLVYLFHINCLLKAVPSEVQKVSARRWTKEQLRSTYDDLNKHPVDYTSKIPPKLDRRYIVTGGNGLVGGFIVLQLLARGTPPLNIRIVDIRKSERNDMTTGPAAEVEFIPTDIRSATAVTAAFDKPWDSSVSHLPLTVFHTAAVILASDRSKYLYAFPYAVNVEGTKNILAAAKAVGADIFSSTSSASIGIRPVDPWVSFWATEPRNFWQILDERDFNHPMGTRKDFLGNYPLSKATAERLVCAENCNGFRTGCIRPANGVYGNPADNILGGPISKSVLPTFIAHVIQNFAHGANVAIAHLQHEAVLLSNDHVENIVQAGRPFVVTDPNPPIAFSDLYNAISTLCIHPFRTLVLPPAPLLVFSHIVEWYNELPYRLPLLARFIPQITGDARHLQPGLFSICTHLIASDAEARKAVAQGGLGYEGVMTTMQGMVLEILEWNREHEAHQESDGAASVAKKKLYTTSVMLADQL
ncbi:MAG: hypothetical protein M1820_010726, partial [Bogoriella megaspora]